MAGEIGSDEATGIIAAQLRGYMSGHVRDADLQVMREIRTAEGEQTPISTLIPAFILSELRAAFLIGLVIYIPFFIIDVVVGATIATVGIVGLPVPALS